MDLVLDKNIVNCEQILYENRKYLNRFLHLFLFILLTLRNEVKVIMV